MAKEYFPNHSTGYLLSTSFSFVASWWIINQSHIALCVKPLRNLEIKNLQKMMTLAPIFSSQNYFRWKYLEVFSFAVSLSIYIWVRVEKSLQQQKLPKNQLQFKQAAERMCIKLRGPVEHFPWKLNPNVFCQRRVGKYLGNICIFQTWNSQWRAAATNLLFSSFF